MFNRRLLGLAVPVRVALGAAVGLGGLGGVAAVLQAWLLSGVIDQVFLRQVAVARLAPWLAGAFGIIVARSLLAWGAEMSAGRVAWRVKRDLRAEVVERLFALGPMYLQGERTGELTAIVSEGIEALDAYFAHYLPQLATAVLVPLTILCTVFPLDALSGGVLLVTAPLIPVFMVLIGQTADRLTRQQYDRLGYLSAHFLDTLQGLTTLKLLGQSRAQAHVIGAVSDQYRDATLQVLRVAFLSALVLEMVVTLSTAIVAVEVGLRLLYGQMAFQPALFILILAPEFYLPLRMLGLRFHSAAAAVSAAARIFEVLAAPLPAGAESPARRSLVPGPAVGWPSAAQEIRFESVSLAYAPGRPALRDISFGIPARKITALIGPSGAGKSTVASLLLRFVEPQQGRIWVGNQPLQAVPPAVWRRHLAWVPQAPHLFHDTLAANIRLGCPTACEAEVIRAAQLAHCHDFICRLPEGYATRVGEGGARLSRGQAQRLALARAFLLTSASLLILDEPTSEVDPELEVLLQEAVERLMRGRTTLVIAHRLSTIYQADQIVVLSAGQVAEVGVHRDLMQQPGLYCQLVTAGDRG